jgi:hypothetical protein|tara:strand:- start:7 stop:165 length:159 start_codon:yes stop_codon:yes gene_type:complete
MIKQFHYIDKNEQEQLDLISLFEYAFDYKVDYDNIVIALSIIEKHIKIKAKI